MVLYVWLETPYVGLFVQRKRPKRGSISEKRHPTNGVGYKYPVPELRLLGRKPGGTKIGITKFFVSKIRGVHPRVWKEHFTVWPSTIVLNGHPWYLLWAAIQRRSPIDLIEKCQHRIDPCAAYNQCKRWIQTKPLKLCIDLTITCA
jgi:hypothetical protein